MKGSKLRSYSGLWQYLIHFLLTRAAYELSVFTSIAYDMKKKNWCARSCALLPGWRSYFCSIPSLGGNYYLCRVSAKL